MVQIAILVAVGDILALDESLRELCGRVVAGLDHRAGDDVLGLGADKGSALAGLDVLELNDLKNLAVLLKGHAVAKLACRNHRNSSISKISLMLDAYLYLFYSIPHDLARGLSKKDGENRKKPSQSPAVTAPPVWEPLADRESPCIVALRLSCCRALFSLPAAACRCCKARRFPIALTQAASKANTGLPMPLPLGEVAARQR